jgi:hypothetical protein
VVCHQEEELSCPDREDIDIGMFFRSSPASCSGICRFHVKKLWRSRGETETEREGGRGKELRGEDRKKEERGGSLEQSLSPNRIGLSIFCFGITFILFIRC